ncbi:MAG TPA: hypothetical protein DCM86_01485, partial [Verrucomicrobiales bacterium]|nr:hypothetical protein [Verrucomicrobiales bacterium]
CSSDLVPFPRLPRARGIWQVVLLTSLLVLLLLGSGDGSPAGAAEAGAESRLGELDRFWARIARAVREGDFEAYQATCHPDGVLVRGAARTTLPLTEALAGWKAGFVETRSGRVKAGVEFRFSQRLGEASSAHETGIFHYFTITADGERKESYVHFEAVLIKRGGWQTLTEYQKAPATRAEWEALK